MKRFVRNFVLATVLAGCLCAVALTAGAAEPIKIGFSMALSGGLAAAGKPALLAMEIWRDDVNQKGGLLGRPVKLVYYDDQSDSKTVPGIYSKLLDVDKVDFVVSPYGSNMIVPALPVVMERNMVFLSLFGMNVNKKFKYDNFFMMMPSGPEPAVDFSQGFFDIVGELSPKPTTVAFLAADSEFAVNLAEGARVQAKRVGLTTVYDDRFPPKTSDFTPILRAIKAKNPDILFIGCYPPHSVGIVKAAKEVGLKPKMWGGGMVGLQFTPIKVNLGASLNGIVNFDFWVPEPTVKFPGIEAFLKRYQEGAPARKIDPLGYYLPPFAYAYVQVLGQAIEATKSTDQKKVGEYIRTHEHNTVVGKFRFAKNGEWATPRTFFTQFQNVKGGSVQEFTQAGKEVVISPKEFRSGKLIYPYPGW